jgi:hypothetical protein
MALALRPFSCIRSWLFLLSKFNAEKIPVSGSVIIKGELKNKIPAVAVRALIVIVGATNVFFTPFSSSSTAVQNPNALSSIVQAIDPPVQSGLFQGSPANCPERAFAYIRAHNFGLHGFSPLRLGSVRIFPGPDVDPRCRAG